jgi:hypothetical protein
MGCAFLYLLNLVSLVALYRLWGTSRHGLFGSLLAIVLLSFVLSAATKLAVRLGRERGEEDFGPTGRVTRAVAGLTWALTVAGALLAFWSLGAF